MKIIQWLRFAFTAQLVTFVGGILVSVIVRAVFGGVITVTESLLAILIIIFIVFAMFVMTMLKKDINTNLIQSRLSSRVFHALRTQDGDMPLYDPVLSILTSAKESVRIVSLYRPSTLEITPGRKKYYQTLNEILEAKHRKGQRFRYERIVQVSEVKHGSISTEQVDLLTYQHCKHIVELQKQKTALTLHLRQIPDVLGAMSFVIVDDRDVIFAIPAVTRIETSEPKALHLGTVVAITDPDGSFVKEMLNLFDDLRLNADPIFSVEH